jgi:hypothetical protein
MKTQEIQKKEWTEFLDSFSRKHEGWLVRMEIFGPEIGAQVEERELALKGITHEWNEKEGDTITIMTGAKPNDHITHSIAGPTQVSLEKTDEGADAALAIKSGDGITTLLRFRSAILPEMVDAVAS